MAYWREKSRGTPGRARLFETQRETEQAAAKLLDTSAENVVLLANSSEALNLLANSIDWKVGRRGAHQRSRVSVECVGVAAFEADRGSREVIPTEGGVLRLEDWTSRLSPVRVWCRSVR